MDKISLKAQIIIGAFLCILIFSGGVKYYEMRLEGIGADEIDVTADLYIEAPEIKTEIEEKELTVHVIGAVEKPGVYNLEEGSRVNDAVQLAIPLEEADLDRLNMAMLLIDGRQIDVPQKGEGESPAETYGSAVPSSKLGDVAQNSNKININTADQALLISLPGIGPAIAKRIIEYREIKGVFYDIQDITNVSGIGTATFDKLKDKITVE
ncbi:MAG: helix-hairpin-helix domain-containing protein [Clostridia bacterium]|nr:helix-hairpin-helix domain-containing protein [Clostridia bacterium]MDD4048372.1 helix-hairpin-helix domain-containing protein [Clostridia bacterium]